VNQPSERFAWQGARTSGDLLKSKTLILPNVLSRATFDGRPIAPKWEKISEANQQWERLGSGMRSGSTVRALGVPRDYRVDAIRGLVLVVMTWSHLPPTVLWRFVVQPFGIVNAAEVFVFASGLVTAWLLGKLLWTSGVRAVIRRAFRRAGQLYLTHLLMVLLLFWAAREGVVPAYLPIHSNPVVLLFNAAIFKLQPTFLDILPMYVLFLLGAPIVLALLARRRAVLVGSLSVALWAVSWYVPQLAHYTFNILAWQLMFVSGMIVGYWRLQHGRSVSLPRAVVAASWALVAVFFVLRHWSFFHLHFPGAIGQVIVYHIDQRHLLLPLRLLDFAATVAVIASIPRTVDRLIPRLLYRGLALLGQSSLQVYAWTVLIGYFARTRLIGWAALTNAEQLMLAAVFALSLFVPALLHRQWRKALKASEAKPPSIVPKVLPSPVEVAEKSAIAGARA